MSLLPFFEWCEASAIGQIIRDSQWLFPVIESVHLIALGAIGGAVLVLDLRMLGVGLRLRSVAEVAREAHPWFLGSLAVMILTGMGLFLSEAIKCYYSQAFWVKISTLPVATLFALTIRRRVAAADDGQISPLTRRAVAVISLLLWFTVAAAGRWIGFS
ncbi:MAG: DUF6644 family protein [Vicinamibacterales bacterium]